MKKIMITLLLLTTISVAQFKSYDTIAPIAPHELTTEQKEVAINHFAEGLSATNVQNKYYAIGVTVQLVEVVYTGIRNIEGYAFKCMSGTAIDSTDQDGFITYYPKVTTQNNLLTLCENKYPSQVDVMTYLLTEMVLYSKSDGSGTWVFYLSQF